MSLILLGQGRNLSCCFYSDGVEVLIEGCFITRLKEAGIAFENHGFKEVGSVVLLDEVPEHLGVGLELG